MTFGTLIRRSLRFHARAHAGVALGAAIGSAALIGALVVGDSVRATLRQRALDRVGAAEYVLTSGDRLFTDATNTWSGAFGDSYTLGLGLPAVASAGQGGLRANQVNLYGVRPDFWKFSTSETAITIQPDSVLLNEALAAQLCVKAGDSILFRFRKPAAFSSEAPLSSRSGNSIALRLRVQGIQTAAQYGDFSPVSSSAAPRNAFVRLDQLQQAAGQEGRANLVLHRGLKALLPRPLFSVRLRLGTWVSNLGFRPPNWLPLWREGDMAPETGVWVLASRLAGNWSAEDAGLEFKALEHLRAVELRSGRVFLDPAVVNQVTHPGGFSSGAQQVSLPPGSKELLLTYLANALRAGTNTTPYSMVTAAGPPYTPAGMGDDEIVVNEWLAEDLGLRPGDWVEAGYFLPDSGANLVEATNRFRVCAVVPLSGIYADRTLMPDFPGIEKAESTRDWDAGFQVDLKRIRPKDEAYWKEHRGTPKAFVTLAAGQKMWGSRFGDVTAIRFPVPEGVSAEEFKQALTEAFLCLVRPKDIGLRFEAVRDQALKAAGEGQDFGQLFLGFSLFLVVAALVLMALLFQLGLEQRTAEVGILLALGLTARQVRRLLLVEGAALALAGGVAGALGGIGYAKAMLWGLSTVWRSAVGGAELQFHATAGSLLMGVCASTAVAVVTIWVTLRRQARRPARELLSGEGSGACCVVRGRETWIAVAAGLAAGGMVGWAVASGRQADAGVFFGAGALLLVAGLAGASAWLGRLGGTDAKARLTMGGLAVRGCARRRKRSVATIALLACGVFVVAAVGVFRLDANRDAARRESGTGGFALIGESTMPVVQDLNTKAGWEFYGLDAKELAGVNVVPLRVREGDVANCLNLNRAQRPRLLGVKPEVLTGRFTFAGVAKGLDRGQGWGLLGRGRSLIKVGRAVPSAPSGHTPTTNAKTPSDIRGALGTARPTSEAGMEEVPAIGDANSIQWALGKRIGDTIDYVDERGRAFKVRLVGAVANSILQGSLLIDEAEFTRRFPGESGYRMFLLDAPSNAGAEVSATLSRALEDAGLELTPAARRLNEFNAVQNTYLGTFQVLGGLGLLLGSAGLGVVVLRNVLERRGELGLLLAVGFRRWGLRRLVLGEHGALLGLGLGLGVAAAAVAVLPAVLSPGTQLPLGSLAVTLGAVLLNGLVWTWVATGFALRGNLLAALRNE